MDSQSLSPVPGEMGNVAEEELDIRVPHSEWHSQSSEPFSALDLVAGVSLGSGTSVKIVSGTFTGR